MNVLTFPDADAVGQHAARLLAEAAAEKPSLTLGLPTGRTMLPFYAALRDRYAAGELDLSRARSFNLDELLLPPHHPGSFRSFMELEAWQRIGLNPEHCDIPDGSADPVTECNRYDRSLAAAAPLDLVFLGVGSDGHVAYNLPGRPVQGTHIVRLDDSLAESLGVPQAWRPLRAITMGFDPLLTAREIVLLATGAHKALAVSYLLGDIEDPAWPCSLLQSHPCLKVLLDSEVSAAAERIR